MYSFTSSHLWANSCLGLNENALSGLAAFGARRRLRQLDWLRTCSLLSNIGDTRRRDYCGKYVYEVICRAAGYPMLRLAQYRVAPHEGVPRRGKFCLRTSLGSIGGG